jgi:hypothetical protein
MLFLSFWEGWLQLPITHYPLHLQLGTVNYVLQIIIALQILHCRFCTANSSLRILHCKFCSAEFCTTQYPQVADMQAGSGKRRADKSLSLSKWRCRWNVISIILRKLFTTTHYPLPTTHYPPHFQLGTANYVLRILHCKIFTADSALQILHYPIPTSRRHASWRRKIESRQITFTSEVKVKVKCYFYYVEKVAYYYPPPIPHYYPCS